MRESPRPPRRFRASIGEVMGLVGLEALAMVWPGLIPTEAVVAFVWVETRGGSAEACARRVSLGVVLAAVWIVPLVHLAWPLPIVPGLRPGPGWREAWSPALAAAPAGLPVVLLEALTGLARFLVRRRPGLELTVAFILGSFATAAQVFGLVRLAGRTWRRRAVAATLGLMLSAVGTHVMTMFLVLAGV